MLGVHLPSGYCFEWLQCSVGGYICLGILPDDDEWAVVMLSLPINKFSELIYAI